MAGKLNKGDVLNTLDSDRTDAALSAAQGKVLNTRKQDKAPEEITINIAANGNDSTGDGSAGKPYKTLPKAVNVLGGMVGQTIATINIGPGTYEMNGLFFHRIQIAKIKVQAANPEKKPVLRFFDGHPLGIFNYHGVKFIDCYNLCFKRSPTSTGESLVASGYTGCIGFSGCEFIGNMKTGLYVGFGSAARIAGCTFKLCDSMKSCILLECRYFVNRLYRATFVINMHNGNENCIITNYFSYLLHIDKAPGVHIDICGFKSLFFHLFESFQNGRMFHLACNNFFAESLLAVTYAKYRRIISLRTTRSSLDRKSVV